MGSALRMVAISVLTIGFAAPVFAQDAYPLHYYAAPQSAPAAPQQMAAENVGGPYYPVPPQPTYAPPAAAQPHYADPAANGQTPEIVTDLRQLNF